MYSEKIMDHFRNPRHHGEIKDADGIGKIGNPRCGDLMYVYIKVKKSDNEEYIDDIKVQTFGCVAAIGSSDVLCGLAKGKTLKEAQKISNKDILSEVGELPPQKVHCSVLAADALKKAIEDYKNNHKNK